jgi:hypothetical protein
VISKVYLSHARRHRCSNSNSNNNNHNNINNKNNSNNNNNINNKINSTTATATATTTTQTTTPQQEKLIYSQGRGATVARDMRGRGRRICLLSPPHAAL